jgi:hypothetical protein
MNAFEILQEDAKNIYIGNLNTVEADLILPAKGKNGSDITWKSSYIHTISDEGKVTRPHAGTGNREVMLTAFLSFGGETLEQSYKLTVLARELNWTAARLIPLEVDAVLGETDNFKLPGCVIAEKDGGGFASLSVKWDAPPMMDSEGMYYVKGAPPFEKQPELVPLAVINVGLGTRETSAPPKAFEPFKLCDVRIEGGIFAENRDRMLSFLLTVDDDVMLYNFRAAAGLDTKGAAPMTGWDAPECLLKGHTTGHYLSALAMAYNSGGNSVLYKKKIEYMVSGLAECQKGDFLSAYSEEQFDLLEQFVPYPRIWAPYYTLHKIFAGLLDCYEFAGEEKALEIVKKLGMWVYRRLKACGEEKRRRMWAMYIAGEYGGMNEVMARLAGIHYKPEFIEAARFFDNDILFEPMRQNVNVLPGFHGNQHIPQMVGALEMFAQTGEKPYYDAALHFWQIAVESHTYSIGGVGEGEMFREANQTSKFITDKTAESCASYNMLKLTSRLFCYTGDVKMADYFERTLYNHIAATHDQSGPTGGTTYFMPLIPGGKKGYDVNGNTCCHGTGLENHLKYQEMVFMRSADGDSLYINLFIPSVLNWKDKGIKINIRDGILERGVTEIVIEGSAKFALCLRIPGWMELKNGELKINGVKVEYEVRNGYAVLEKDFKDGDVIEWITPFDFHFEPTPDNPDIGSILYGPLVLAVESDETEYLKIGGLTPEKTDEPLTFKCGGYTLRPNYAVWDRPYHVYVTK